MNPFKLHALLGIVLLICGFAFDFGFVTTTANFKGMLGSQTPQDLWKSYAYELTRYYFFVLGFTSMAFGVLGFVMGIPRRSAWIIFTLVAGGSILFLGGGVWEAQIGPVYKNEPPCYVLGTGLIAILAALAFEGYALLSVKANG